MIALKYKQGLLVKATSKYRDNILRSIQNTINIPSNLKVNDIIYILGVIYKLNPKKIKAYHEIRKYHYDSLNNTTQTSFCAFQILNTDLNQISQLVSLKALGFCIPPSENVKVNSYQAELYLDLIEQRQINNRIFPNKGIVLKVNSRKLQKQIGNKNSIINWACSVTNRKV